MPVKVVTDSTSDLPPKVAQELGITVVPVYVRFGEEVYRDGIDISHEELYQKLVESPVHPSTSQPPPSDFADVYRKLARETDEIVSIQVTGKLSGTYDSALRGRELAPAGCHIEVIDSLSVSMGLGLMAMAAARLARAGESLQRVVDEVRQAIDQVHVFGLFDTLKYLSLGGRIGKAKALLGALLSVKPLLTMHDGELAPSGLVRTRAKGMERLLGLVKNTLNIQELAVVHSTTPDEANSLRDRLGSIVAEERIHLARLGPALGVHGGPGTLILALRGKAGNILPGAGEDEPLKKRFSLPSLPIPGLKFSYPQL
jgi:fatty acid kinase fatty acid binding subunit